MALIKKVFRKETFWELAKGAGMSFLLCLWYLVPFLDYWLHEDLHIKNVSARTIQDMGLYLAQLAFQYWKYGYNVMLGDAGMQHSRALGVGAILVLGFGVFIVLWFCNKWEKEDKNIACAGKWSVVFGGILMFMSLNIFPWDRIQQLHPVLAALISSLQYPHRFLGWGTVFLVVIFGSCLWYFKARRNKWEYYVGIICVFMAVSSSMYLLEHVYKESDVYQLYNEESMGTGYISGAEYLVEGTDDGLLTYNTPVISEYVEIEHYNKEYLYIELVCSNTGDVEGYIEVPLLHYKGYQARVKESGEMLDLVKGNNNVVRVEIPASFSGTIEIHFVSPIAWRISEVISFLSMVGLAAWFLNLKYKKRDKREKVYG